MGSACIEKGLACAVVGSTCAGVGSACAEVGSPCAEIGSDSLWSSGLACTESYSLMSKGFHLIMKFRSNIKIIFLSLICPQFAHFLSNNNKSVHEHVSLF